ncbi:MAG: metallophosphoesterase [Bdellovibrionales bacterium]|nr:metallophosphoesterase [Bdellovibrionales bacterium]
MSRSLTDQRFSESASLSGPSNTVVVADPADYSFSFVGDMHIAGADVRYLNQILDDSAAQGDAFHISLGDIVDEGEASDFDAFYNAVMARGWGGKLFTAIGNHDVFYDGWNYYKQRWGASHYVFTVGNTKFIVFDTADGNVGESQMDWIESELNNSSATNNVFVSHYMPLVPGIQTYLRLANREEALSLMRLATQKGVRAWIGGHYHSYISEEVDGVQYVVAGGGGGRRMPPVKEYFYVQAKVVGASLSFTRRTIE